MSRWRVISHLVHEGKKHIDVSKVSTPDLVRSFKAGLKTFMVSGTFNQARLDDYVSFLTVFEQLCANKVILLKVSKSFGISISRCWSRLKKFDKCWFLREFASRILQFSLREGRG